MHPGWQGGFPQKALWEQFRTPTSCSCSEPPSGETSPCSRTRKEKLAGEVGSLGLHGMTLPISFFKTGGSGKSTFKIKTAAAFTLLIIPRGTASDFAGAGGLVSAGISFPAKDNVRIAEITRQGRAAGREGAQMEGGPGQERLPGRRDRGAPGPARHGRLPGEGRAVCLAFLLLLVLPGLGAELPWAAVPLPPHSRGCWGGRRGGAPGRAGRGAWPGAAWQQGRWEKPLPPALPCCGRGQLVALLGSVKGGTSVPSALLASVSVFVPGQQRWGAPRLLWRLGKARGWVREADLAPKPWTSLRLGVISQRKPLEPPPRFQQSHWDYFCIKSRWGKEVWMSLGREKIAKVKTIYRNRCGLARYACGSVCRQERAAPQSLWVGPASPSRGSPLPALQPWPLPPRHRQPAGPAALALPLPAPGRLGRSVLLRAASSSEDLQQRAAGGKRGRNLVPAVGRVGILGISTWFGGRRLNLFSVVWLLLC